MKSGDAGKSSVSVQAKDKAGSYGSPSLPLAVTGGVTAQLVVNPGSAAKKCFSIDFATATKNEAKQFSTKK